jgi:FeS assembly SUF system protein
MNANRTGTLKPQVIAALRTVQDPEIPLNIYDLGLIYGLDVEPSGQVRIRMTLTNPACPVADAMPRQVEATVRAVPGVTGAEVRLVWDPPWTREAMSEAARLQLGLDEELPHRSAFVPVSALWKEKPRSPK